MGKSLKVMVLLLLAIATAAFAGDRPNILVVTVDTLRSDRMSAFGYERSTSPNLDRLMKRGAWFTRARTIEPLTNPALSSMLTSQHPQQHGSTRNGLRMRSGLASLPKAVQASGYRTAAFVGNWTLRDRLSGLGEHFELYEEILTRRRWFGLVRSEANAEDVSTRAMEWIANHVRERRNEPFFTWVHYVEPHAPYRYHREYAGQLGLGKMDKHPPAVRYDTEIAFVDHAIGSLLKELENLGLDDDTMIVFASDHGESLGEHGYWGHGRFLYEPTLRIPMSITWPGHIAPREIDAPSLIIDLAPTVLSLLDQDHPSDFAGYDWTGVMAGGEPPRDRLTHYQAHRGAVISRHDSDLARKSGLLAVGIIKNDLKEIYRVENGRRRLFDLGADPGELQTLTRKKESPSEGLQGWIGDLQAALDSFDDAPPEPLDEESIEALRSLGYVD
jgi:arylsulfatase A-like enzyme